MAVQLLEDPYLWCSQGVRVPRAVRASMGVTGGAAAAVSVMRGAAARARGRGGNAGLLIPGFALFAIAGGFIFLGPRSEGAARSKREARGIEELRDARREK